MAKLSRAGINANLEISHGLGSGRSSPSLLKLRGEKSDGHEHQDSHRAGLAHLVEFERVVKRQIGKKSIGSLQRPLGRNSRRKQKDP